MLVPSKFTRLEESTLFRMSIILREKNEAETIHDVYLRTRDVFRDASEFLSAMDALFVLGFLNIENDSGLIKYA